MFNESCRNSQGISNGIADGAFHGCNLLSKRGASKVTINFVGNRKCFLIIATDYLASCKFGGASLSFQPA